MHISTKLGGTNKSTSCLSYVYTVCGLQYPAANTYDGCLRNLSNASYSQTTENRKQRR